MLRRKMFREMKENAGQFLSIFILAFIAMAMYVTMEGHVIGENNSRAVFHEACNLADVWVYGEGFTEEQLSDVRNLDFVKDIQLRMSVTGSAPDFDGAQTDLYLERENLVNMPYFIEGEAFDSSDMDGIWLANAFAKARNISVGDDFKISYNGITFTRKVKGLMESVEYEYRQAETDSDVDVGNIAIVYMSYDAFPIRDYVNHMIEQGKITVDLIQKETNLLDPYIEQLEANGMNTSDLTQESLKEMIKQLPDEKLAKIMPYTQMILTTTDGEALSHEDDIKEALNGKYSAMIDSHSIMGIERLNSEVLQHQSFSYLFVIIFVGIAVLIIATTMSRMVEKQRTQIGTMNALGMKSSKIIIHYMSFGFLNSLLGALAGLLFGCLVLAPWMVGFFAQWYIVPGLAAGVDISYIGIVILITAVCTFASFFSCRKVLKIKPAESLRPAAPKQGKNCIFEKLPFWNKLSFNTQYNLRDLSRAKLRSIMCVIGTAVGMLLMVYGLACNSLITDIVDLNFDKVQTAEYQMNLSDDVNLEDAEQIKSDVAGELAMMGQIEIAKVKNAISSEKQKESITVLEGNGMLNLVDSNQKQIAIQKGSIGVSRKLCKDLGLSVGDTFYWHLYSKDTWNEAKVGYIYQSSEGQGITYLRSDYEKTGAEYTPNVLYSNEDLSKYEDEDYATAVHKKEDLIKAYEKSMSVISIMVWMMVGFSSILIVVVLYNSGNLSFNERIKEFATLKVIGFQSNRIRRILTVQNLWLSMIGIIIGSPFAKMTLNEMMNSNGADFDYNLVIHTSTYLISGILVLAVAMVVGFLFSKRIKKLDMVEVLKGVE